MLVDKEIKGYRIKIQSLEGNKMVDKNKRLIVRCKRYKLNLETKTKKTCYKKLCSRIRHKVYLRK